MRNLVRRTIVEKKDGRRGWPLVRVALMERRFVANGGNSWSGTSYSKGYVTTGVQGITLLDDGSVYEYCRLRKGRAIALDREYDSASDLPPTFVMDPPAYELSFMNIDRELDSINDHSPRFVEGYLVYGREFKDPMERQTGAIKNWAAKLEEIMKGLAKDCMRRLNSSS